MSFASNLKALRQAKGLTQEQLAHACGWRGQSRVANYESTGKSGREPSEADIRALAAALEVTVAELFGEYPSAEDEYISRRHERSVRERDELRAYAGLPPLSHDLVEVPVFDLEVAAGGGAMNFDMPAKGSLMFQASSLRRKGISAKTSAVGYVRGDSMLPRLRDGDALLFDRADTIVRPGKVYVIRRGDEAFVKRLFPEGLRYRVVSDNKSDPQWTEWYVDVHDPDLEIVGRVRWVASWED
jgi:phage repressor protein C with HTH and peptisase S24 domain